MKRTLSKTIIFLSAASLFFAGLSGCKKTTTSGPQTSTPTSAAPAERPVAAAPVIPTPEPVKDWYNKEDREFTLTTAGQLAGLAKLVNSGNSFKGKTIILGENIDLSGYHAKSKFNDGKGWVPIGSNRSKFRGTFDGNGKAVRGLYINDPMLFYAGLLGRLDSATVRNVNVLDVNINAHSRAGAVAGGVGSSTLNNCTGSGQIKGKASYVGGIVGYARRGSSISASDSKADVNGNNYIGGIVGDVNGGSRVTRCHSSGKVTGEVVVGGIAGSVKDRGSSVTNSYSSAKITTGSQGGGIAGLVIQGGSVRNCYSTSEVSGRTLVGGIVGQAGQEGQATQQPRQARQTAQITDSLSNNVALNSSVKATIGIAGRLQGHNKTRLVMLSNAAFGGLTNHTGNTDWSAKGDRGKDGPDITKEEIAADGTLGGRFTSQNGWTTEDGKLPGFREAVLMPQHLR
jgi:hypothetical protein